MKHHCEFEKASSVFILEQILKEFKRKRNLNMRMELIVHYCKKHKDKTLSSRAIEQKYISVLLCNLVLFLGYGTEKQILY